MGFYDNAQDNGWGDFGFSSFTASALQTMQPPAAPTGLHDRALKRLQRQMR